MTDIEQLKTSVEQASRLCWRVETELTEILQSQQTSQDPWGLLSPTSLEALIEAYSSPARPPWTRAVLIAHLRAMHERGNRGLAQEKARELGWRTVFYEPLFDPLPEVSYGQWLRRQTDWSDPEVRQVRSMGPFAVHLGSGIWVARAEGMGWH